MGFVAAAGILMASQAFAQAPVYTIDTAHASIGFSVKHMMISTTTGVFKDFAGTIAFDPADLSSSKVDVTIQAKSIDTHQEKRDEHLRNADFFDVEKFPTITFVSKSLGGTNGAYALVGDLTMKGVTKEVTIPITIVGPVKGAMGGNVIGLSGQFILNRQDYGVTYNKTLDAGGLAVGNDVTVNVNLEAVQK